MKQINTLIIFFLCLMVVGFFANFAQNDYGMELVMLGCLLITIFLFARILISVKRFKTLRFFAWLGVISGSPILISQGFFSISFNKVLFNNVFFLPLYFITFLLFIAIFLVILPLIAGVAKFRKKLSINFFEYFLSLFSAFLCLGIYMKNMHKLGASPILAFSGFVIFPLFIIAIKAINKYIKERKYHYLTSALVYFFIGFTFVAYIFKSMHWPSADIMVLITSKFLYVILLWFICLHFGVKQYFKNWWQHEVFMVRALFSTFVVTTIYVQLRMNETLPQLYSNQYPKAYQELKSNANNVTKEGKIFSMKTEEYLKHYEDFIINQQEQIK